MQQRVLTVCDVTLRYKRPNEPEEKHTIGGAELQPNVLDRSSRRLQSLDKGET